MEIVKGQGSLTQRLHEFTPDRCCTCGGPWRSCNDQEMEAIMVYVRRVELPEVFLKHRVRSALICAHCGHVILLTQFKKWLAMWCPGFGLHAAPGRTI